jgi:hypothetical protein
MKLFEPEKKIASPENVDLPEEVACGSGYSGYFLSIRIREKKVVRIHRKRIVEPRKLQRFGREKGWIRKVGPLKKLTCGSNHLNCRWVFGSAKRLVVPRVSDPQKECPDPEGKSGSRRG